MISLLDGNSYLIYLAAIAGLLHASLQMPSATFLHMAGFAIGRNQRTKAFVLSLVMSLGVFLTVGLLLMVTSQVAGSILDPHSRYMLAGILTTLAGLFVMLRYFRDSPGAQLWLPRKHIRWFHKQIENTNNTFGAFGMGMISILSEIGIAFPLMLSAGALIINTSPAATLTGLAIYSGIVTLPLLLAGIALLTGANPVALQRWRIEGKRFWQFFIGLAFVVFGLYIASEQFTYSVSVLGVS